MFSGAVQESHPPPVPWLRLVEQVEGERCCHCGGHHRTGGQIILNIVRLEFSHLFLLLQFNAVSYRVISTVLIDSEARPSQRARVISAWVDVAQVPFQQQNMHQTKIQRAPVHGSMFPGYFSPERNNAFHLNIHRSQSSSRSCGC